MSIEEIHRICLKYNIKNYTINDDLSIDVDDNVDLYHKSLTELPLKFKNVIGFFDCSYNNLTSLEGSPILATGWFDCSNNNLTTLEFSPGEVGRYFKFFSNPLESLIGIPLNLPKDEFYESYPLAYSNYLEYSNRIKRNLKFKKILK